MDDAQRIATPAASITVPASETAIKPQCKPNFLDDLRTALMCPICKAVMSKPYMAWFQKQLDEKGNSILIGSKQPIRKAFEILGSLMTTTGLFNRRFLKYLFRLSHFPEPIFKCPDCGAYIVLPPTKDKTLTDLAAASALVDYNDQRRQTVEGPHPFQALFPCIFTDKISSSELEDLGVLDDDTVVRMVERYYPEFLEPDSDDQEDEER